LGCLLGGRDVAGRLLGGEAAARAAFSAAA